MLRRNGQELRLDEIEVIVETAFTAIKDIVREGDCLHYGIIGKFYPKEMEPRKVKGGLRKMGKKSYQLPARRKLGFRSFKATDEYVRQPVVDRYGEGGALSDVLFDD